ncbi:hypothetical protein N2599_36600 (plasmid) [Rhizobium sullae]|uniref:DUF7007 domain-containing protein n=1 Tax=Rhizobium sullae TaxID=50338 RepID=A0ABY5XYC6_RHISU|nr:hypothetical protein [Rhizobium sullae]UWU19556.1 hypothetical protein N2599_36600 [Rhizobium sullae]
MTRTRLQNDNTAAIPDGGVEFGTSADGFPVARIGDTLLAMVPGHAGSYFLASAWRLSRPLSELKRDHFYGHDGRLDDEAAFRARVLATAQHKRELAALARVQTRMPASTPWGTSQLATLYADGVVLHCTASHGGFHLSPDRNAKVDPDLRNFAGFYEEDAECAIVAITFPGLFTRFELESADETIRNSWPNVWEKMNGRELLPRQSWMRDRLDFERRHAGDWVVISAIYSNHHPDMTEVIATRGAKRDGQTETMRFLVSRTEYATRGRFGFVIDADRHDAYDGPSSFAGRQGRAV